MFSNVSAKPTFIVWYTMYDHSFKNSNDAKRNTKCVPYYDELCVIFGDDQATGGNAITGNEANIELPYLEEIENCPKGGATNIEMLWIHIVLHSGSVITLVRTPTMLCETRTITSHNLILYFGEENYYEKNFCKDSLCLDVLKICNRFIDVYIVGFKITNEDGMPLRNDKDVMSMMKEHEGFELRKIVVDFPKEERTQKHMDIIFDDVVGKDKCG
ncbi:hypothetical protein Syun_009439 [Stephania yunnanensis]|uniref:Uncharacterized protein n=1 Tax=Stephania yunnanensis TaxID=152371 RepID=A0AAP0KFJ9_9MAGN